MAKATFIRVNVSDLISWYRAGLVENCYVGASCALDDECVLIQHVQQLLIPVRGINSVNQFLKDGELYQQLLNWRLPGVGPDQIKDHLILTITGIQKRCIDSLDELPLAQYWYCEVDPWPGNYHLMFYGGGNEAQDYSPRRAADSAKADSAHPRPSNANWGYGGRLLSELANAKISAQRRRIRLAQHDLRMARIPAEDVDSNEGSIGDSKW